LTPNEFVFPFVGSYVCANFGKKIDQEMRPRECPQTDTLTDTLTDANQIYDLSHMLYAIANGQITNTCIEGLRASTSTPHELEVCCIRTLLWMHHERHPHASVIKLGFCWQ